MGGVTLTTPLSGMIFIDRMGLDAVNLYTKYEVYRCIRYEAMNGGAKWRKLGSFGWLGDNEGQGNVTIR